MSENVYTFKNCNGREFCIRATARSVHEWEGRTGKAFFKILLTAQQQQLDVPDDLDKKEKERLEGIHGTDLMMDLFGSMGDLMLFLYFSSVPKTERETITIELFEEELEIGESVVALAKALRFIVEKFQARDQDVRGVQQRTGVPLESSPGKTTSN